MNRLHLSIIAITGSLLILPTAVFSTAIAPNPQSIQLASSLSSAQIRQLAQAITVKVLATSELGSGILIAKQGTTYTVLTNAHVLNSKGNYRIQTPDGKIHSAVVKNKGNSLKGNDLAVLQFKSEQTYRIVALATTTTKAENQSVYAAGFPIDSQQLLITTGKISIIAPKPLLGGYQLGYTNETKQGMSGGPLLNQAGQLIGVNGLLNYAILNDTYTYQDGSSPSDQLRQQLRKVSFAVPIQTLAQVAPQLAVVPLEWIFVSNQLTLTGLAGEIDTIAQQITLRIDSKNNGNGSGVIIARQGQTYYVLTAYHVVDDPDQYTVLTPDGQTHPIKANDIVKEEGLDVAIVKFSSQKEYPVATLAKYNLSDPKRHWVFLSGFPGSAAGKRQFNPGFRFDTLTPSYRIKGSFPLNNGYELVFTNLSLPGMSGGPLLDIKGRVIGIGGRQEGEIYSIKLERNLGYALGVPITTGLGLATKAGIKAEWMKLETSLPPTVTAAEDSSIRNHPSFTAEKPSLNADENEWLNYGNLLWRLDRFDEAVAALQQATTLNPDFYQAYYSLGLVLQNQGKYPDAVATFKQVIKINPDYYQAWRELSATFVGLKKYPEDITAIDHAIKIDAEQTGEYNPQDFILYVSKSNTLSNLKRYTEAEAALNQAINIKPSSLAYYNRGLLRKELKNYPAAEADYTQAIILNPELAQAYIARSVIRKELKNYLAAEADYNQAIILNPENAQAYYNRGLLRKELKNYPAAEADYNRAIKLNPEYAEAYIGRGLLRKELKNHPAAEADFTQAIKLNPENAYAYYRRGLLRIQVKNYPGAEADFTQAIKLDPEYADAYYRRGSLRQELKNYPGAEADFTQVIKLDPENAYAYSDRGSLRTEVKNYPGAEADFTQAIKLDPEDAYAYFERGNFRTEVKNYPGAEADFTQVIKLNPESAYAYNNRGNFRIQVKNYPGAEADYTQAIRINPEDAKAYNNRGNLRKELKNYPGAEADYTQAIRINREDAQAYNNRGIIREELRNYPGAEADYTQAIRINPEDAEAYVNRGVLRTELKNYPGAEADYNQAIRINPEDAKAYVNRGIIRTEQKNYPGAEADLQLAAQLYRKQNNTEAYQQVQQILSQLQTLPK